MIDSAGAINGLKRLLNSGNENISSYAAAVLYTMSQGQKNRNRDMYCNSMEMNNPMYRNMDQNHWTGQTNNEMGDMDMMCDEPFMDHYM